MRLEVLVLCAAVTNSTWLVSAAVLFLLKAFGPLDPGSVPIRFVRWIFHEIKPFFRAFAAVVCVAYCVPWTSTSWLTLLVTAGQLYLFHALKDVDDDDDRWTRRKRLALEKITFVDGRLAVTPA